MEGRLLSQDELREEQLGSKLKDWLTGREGAAGGKARSWAGGSWKPKGRGSFQKEEEETVR